MREKTPQEYMQEMIEMYSLAKKPQSDEGKINAPDAFSDLSGGLKVNVTTLRGLYPVPNAEIVVFTGDMNSKTVIERAVSDQSGQSGVFKLKTPSKALSESAEAAAIPYATYNLSVAADGYVDRIFMDIPVFSGVVSVQGVDLLPISAAGGNTSPDITKGENSYEL